MKKKIIIFACLSWALATGVYALDEAGEFLRMCQYGSQEQQKTIRAIATELKINFEPRNFLGLFNKIKNIEFLYIMRKQKIKDLSPLRAMKKIRVLGIVGNDIEDLRPLSGLRTLTDLQVNNNKISDLNPLAGLGNLRELNISRNNKMSDLRPLINLSKLEILYANNNSIEDITPIVKLSNLKNVGLAYNKIKDISVLNKNSFNKKIKMHFVLSDNQITDISPLSALADNLEELHLTRNQITDIRPLAKLKKLKELNIAINNIRDVSPLAGLTQLEKLAIYDNPITDLSPLKRLTKLKKLDTDNLKLLPGTPQNFGELQHMMGKERNPAKE